MDRCCCTPQAKMVLAMARIGEVNGVPSLIFDTVDINNCRAKEADLSIPLSEFGEGGPTPTFKTINGEVITGTGNIEIQPESSPAWVNAITQNDLNHWNSAYTNMHTHSNKAILDQITAAYTTAEKTKLAGIASGAEVNVQTNWAENDPTSDAYLINRPTFKTINGETIIGTGDITTGGGDVTPPWVNAITQAQITNWDIAYTNMHTHTNKALLDSLTGFKTINGQTVTGSGDIAIQGENSPTWVNAITQQNITDWNNAASLAHTHANKTILDQTTAAFTTTDKTKLDSISPQVQADYNQTDPLQPDYIKNKPVNKYVQLLGDGTNITYNITHNLGTKNITFSVRDTATNEYIITDTRAVDDSTITLTFTTPPTANAYEITVIK